MGGRGSQKLFIIDLNFRKKGAPCVEPKPDVNCDYSCQNGFCMVKSYHSKLEFRLLFEFRNKLNSSELKTHCETQVSFNVKMVSAW